MAAAGQIVDRLICQSVVAPKRRRATDAAVQSRARPYRAGWISALNACPARQQAQCKKAHDHPADEDDGLNGTSGQQQQARTRANSGQPPTDSKNGAAGNQRDTDAEPVRKLGGLSQQIPVTFPHVPKPRHGDEHRSPHRERERGIPLPRDIEKREHPLRIEHAGHEQPGPWMSLRICATARQSCMRAVLNGSWIGASWFDQSRRTRIQANERQTSKGLVRQRDIRDSGAAVDFLRWTTVDANCSRDRR
jgi:hypothetical protein